MAEKHKWQVVDVDALDKVFILIDKINQAAVRALIGHDEKDFLISKLKEEVNSMVTRPIKEVLDNTESKIETVMTETVDNKPDPEPDEKSGPKKKSKS